VSTPIRRAIASATILLSLLLPAFGAAAADPLGAIPDEDRPTLEALSLYPEDMRRHVLEAATEAHVLAELGARQERSRASFRDLLDPYDQDIQDDLFQLTRYPALVAEIVEGGPKEVRELDVIAARYPEEIREPARSAREEHWKLVARVHALLAGEQAAFQELVADLPDVKQTAFLALLGTPEVLALLSEHTAMTVLLGDAYEREPDAVIAALDALQVEVAERNAEEARDFAETVAADPELEQEVESSYREYEQETARDVNVTVNVVRPYSYWVGVPWWVRADYSYYDPWVHWYPRPYWRHCGYRYGPRFPVVHGAPVYGWYGWYFNRPVHHHRYPRLSNHILLHHHRHGYYGDSGHRRGWGVHRGHYGRRFGPGRHAVGHFVRNAEREMPAGFLRAGHDRPQRLAEYGRLHNDLRRADRRSGEHRKHGRHGKPGKHGRQDLDRVVASRPGDFPALASLAKDEKTRWRDRSDKKPSKGEDRWRDRSDKKPDKGKDRWRDQAGKKPDRGKDRWRDQAGKKPDKGKDRWKQGHDARVDRPDTGPQRIPKPSKSAGKGTSEPTRRSYKKPAKNSERIREMEPKQRWQSTEKQAKKQRQAAEKQAKQQRQSAERQAKQRQQATDRQAKQRQRNEAKQRQAAEKQARQHRQTEEKQAKQRQRTADKQAKQQQRTEKKQAKQQRQREAWKGGR